MTIRTLAAAAKIALPVVALAFALPALAVDVTFSTTGEFCNSEPCSSGSSSITIGSGKTAIGVAYTGVGPVNLVLGPEVDLGVLTLTTSATNPGFSGTFAANQAFALLVNQSTPGPTSGQFNATLNGTVEYDNGAPTGSHCLTPGIGNCSATDHLTSPGPPYATINFTNNTIVLDNITYSLFTTTQNIPLPTVGNPDVIGQIGIEAAVTPEPTFMLLTGVGFAGVAFVAYRRRRAA